MKKIIILLLILLPVAIGGVLMFKNSKQNISGPGQQVVSTQSPSQKNSPSPTPKQVATVAEPKEEAGVPLPSGEDVIRTFFELIHTGQIDSALDMLSSSFAPTNEAKQTVAVLFNSFTAIQPLEIKPFEEENWTEEKQKYEVTLDVAISLDDEEWAMQQYGWLRGENTRWVTLVKEEGLWKVDVLATGP